MIERYQRPWMKALFSDYERYTRFLDVELAALKAYVKLGKVPREDFDKIEAGVFIDVLDISEVEKETHHDVIAFTRSVTRKLGDEKKWFHYGLTSTDIVDTALGIAIKTANQGIEADINKLIRTLRRHAIKYKNTPIIGRTHGMHADVTSFGLKFALWSDLFERHLERFKDARKSIEVGKISGAVGTYAHTGMELEIEVCKLLNLNPVSISTQVINRDRHAHYLHVLALIASGVEQIALEIRHLQRTEIGEVKEAFGFRQKGSSAMPHKRNPIASENLMGVARVVRGYVIPAYEDIALWHERDISHSSVERIIIPDAMSLVDYMLDRIERVLDGIEVYEDKMLEHILMTDGVIFSQYVLHALIEKGWTREKAYDMIQPLTFQVRNKNMPFKDILKSHPEITAILSNEEIEACFDPHQALKYVDGIYDRLGITNDDH
jgi:adenylosuccinate lyase